MTEQTAPKNLDEITTFVGSIKRRGIINQAGSLAKALENFDVKVDLDIVEGVTRNIWDREFFRNEETFTKVDRAIRNAKYVLATEVILNSRYSSEPFLREVAEKAALGDDEKTQFLLLMNDAFHTTKWLLSAGLKHAEEKAARLARLAENNK